MQIYQQKGYNIIRQSILMCLIDGNYIQGPYIDYNKQCVVFLELNIVLWHLYSSCRKCLFLLLQFLVTQCSNSAAAQGQSAAT